MDVNLSKTILSLPYKSLGNVHPVLHYAILSSYHVKVCTNNFLTEIFYLPDEYLQILQNQNKNLYENYNTNSFTDYVALTTYLLQSFSPNIQYNMFPSRFKYQTLLINSFLHQDNLSPVSVPTKILYRYSNPREYDIIDNISIVTYNLSNLLGDTLNDNINKLLSELDRFFIKPEDINVIITPVMYNFQDSGKPITLNKYLDDSKGQSGNIIGFFEFDLNNQTEWDRNLIFSSDVFNNNEILRNLILLQTINTPQRINVSTFTSSTPEYIPNITLESYFSNKPGVLQYFRAGTLMTQEGLLTYNPDITLEQLRGFQNVYGSLTNEKQTEINFVGKSQAFGVKLDFNITSDGYSSIRNRYVQYYNNYANSVDSYVKNYKPSLFAPPKDKYSDYKRSSLISVRNLTDNTRSNYYTDDKLASLDLNILSRLRLVVIDILSRTKILSQFYLQYVNICENGNIIGPDLTSVCNMYD